MTARGIKRFNRVKGKPLRPIMLHKRIDAWYTSHHAVADAIEAVKWIGNGGSHDDSLTVEDVLDGARILELAVKALYDKSEAKLMAKVKVINRSVEPGKQARLIPFQCARWPVALKGRRRD